MQFGFCGINYKNAKLVVRDKTAFTDSRKLQFCQRAENVGIEQCMILSTCNRSEIFFFYTNENQLERIKQIYIDMFSDIDLSTYLESKSGEEAMSYLFRITAGIESLVPGEDQILGQVKDALNYACTMGYCGKELNKVVRDAITCAKKIKTELKASQKPLSVSYVGIKKLESVCGIAGKTVLIIGSGKTAVLALQYVYELSAARIIVCSRTYAHAKKLCIQFPGIETVSYEQRYEKIGECDIVISATSSPHLVISHNCFIPVRKVVFLDLAAPRDIDTAYATDPYACLIDLDTLCEIVNTNMREREQLINASRQIIDENVKETSNWFLHSRVDATIASLQQRCDTIVNDSYEYLNRKMDLNTREQKLLKKVLHASLQRLIREPIIELKQLHTEEEQDQYNYLIQQLFQIKTE